MITQVPPTTLKTDAALRSYFATRLQALEIIDNDVRQVIVEDDLVMDGTIIVHAAIYLGIPLIEVWINARTTDGSTDGLDY